MKTESILNREGYNKDHEEIIKLLDEIVSSLGRIEVKLSKMLGENHRRLNEELTNKIDLGAFKDEK